jgi:ribosome-associated heat shock protein Hsp15
MENKIRIDKFLWAIRIFKTRSLAAEYCNNGKVKADGKILKPSYKVQTGIHLFIQVNKDLTRQIEVISLTDKRTSFEIAKKHYIDHTILPEKKIKEENVFFKPDKYLKNNERPTKKLGRAWRNQMDS